MVGWGGRHHGGATGAVYGQQDEGSDEDGLWTVDVEETECEEQHTLDQKGPTDVLIDPPVLRKVLSMCFLHKDTEFMVYLLGDPDDEERRATDVYVPNQHVSRAHVEQPGDPDIPGNVIGVLHKHPGRGPQNFSMTDDRSLNVNHDISLVIPSNGTPAHWTGEVRHQLECGCVDTRKARVLFDIVDDDVLEASEERVERRTVSRVTKTNGANDDEDEEADDSRDVDKDVT